MDEDKCRFGAAAWACVTPRLEKLRFLLAKETLQHMRTTEMCLNRKKDGIKEKVCVILMTSSDFYADTAMSMKTSTTNLSPHSDFKTNDVSKCLLFGASR